MERSTDRGQSFQSLPDLPYSDGVNGVADACVTIIDDNTVFIAGGLAKDSKNNGSYKKMS